MNIEAQRNAAIELMQGRQKWNRKLHIVLMHKTSSGNHFDASIYWVNPGDMNSENISQCVAQALEYPLRKDRFGQHAVRFTSLETEYSDIVHYINVTCNTHFLSNLS